MIPRNHLVEAAITAAETGDSSQCHTLFTNSTHPYDLGALSYQDLRPAKPGDWIGRTFCGT
jgi:serine/tyrosine/threonine adenylyltransferase